MSNTNVFTVLSKKAAKKSAPLPAHAAPVLPKQMFQFAQGQAATAWGDDEVEPVTSLSMPLTPAEALAAQQAQEEDDEESESESEDEEEEEVSKPAAPVVSKPKPVAAPQPVLSKKELKQKELDELDSVLAELGLATETPAQNADGNTEKKSKKKKKKGANASSAPAAPQVAEPVQEEAPTVIVDIKSVMAKKNKGKKKDESLAVKKAREEEAKKKAAMKTKRDRSTFNEFS